MRLGFNMSKTKTTVNTSETKGNEAPPIHTVRGHAKRKGPIAIVMMALYQFANDGLVSGRTGGDVKMRNGRSRKMTVPALVRNSYTSFVRSVFAYFSAQFRNLSSDQIIAWNNFDVFKSNRFGVKINIKGKAAFVQLNANLANIGATGILTDPPVGQMLPAPTQIDALTVTIGVLDLYTEANADGAKTLVYATKPLSVGISRPSQSAYRLISVVNTVPGTVINLTGAYNDKFGVIPDGTKVFIQLRVINAITGLSSAITQASVKS